MEVVFEEVDDRRIVGVRQEQRRAEPAVGDDEVGRRHVGSILQGGKNAQRVRRRRVEGADASVAGVCRQMCRTVDDLPHARQRPLVAPRGDKRAIPAVVRGQAGRDVLELSGEVLVDE